MYDLDAQQAIIDRHIETARKCLVSSIPHLASSREGTQHDIVEERRQGTRTAAKIIHLRTMIATLTPIPATTEADQHSVFDRLLASVEMLWNERRERVGDPDARDPSEYQRPLAHVDPLMIRHSLELSPVSIPRHRRAGSSRI